jgi:hypothetical protein
MLQNDLDSQRSARAPWILGRSRKNLARRPAAPKRNGPSRGDRLEAVGVDVVRGRDTPGQPAAPQTFLALNLVVRVADIRGVGLVTEAPRSGPSIALLPLARIYVRNEPVSTINPPPRLLPLVSGDVPVVLGAPPRFLRPLRRRDGIRACGVCDDAGARTIRGSAIRRALNRRSRAGSGCLNRNSASIS